MKHVALMLLSLFVAFPTLAKEKVLIAAVDGGLDVAHPDLKGKIWFNAAEKSGKAGADDDRNGYADDINGYNLAGKNNVLWSDAAVPSKEIYRQIIRTLNIMTKLGANKQVSPKEVEEVKARLPLIKQYIAAAMDGMHGTHVTGIMSKDNDAVVSLGLKILGDDPKPQGGDEPASPEEIIARIGLIGPKLASAETPEDIIALLIPMEMVSVDDIIAMLINMYTRNQLPHLRAISSYVGQQKVRVANCSWGEDEQVLLQAIVSQFPYLLEDREGLVKILIAYRTIAEKVFPELIKAAPDTLFTMAAGNSSLDNDKSMVMPANLKGENKITVGALTEDGTQLTDFSNFGAKSVDIAAPGELIESTVPMGEHALMSGTSQAAPHVARAASLIISENPALKPGQVKAILMGTSDQLPGLAGKVKSGALNVKRAIAAAKLSTSSSVEQAIAKARDQIKARARRKALAVVTQPVVSDLGGMSQFYSAQIKAEQVSTEQKAVSLVGQGFSKAEAREITKLLKKMKRVNF